MRDKRDFGCNIVLIGVMGAGKSTIARTLSDMYGLEVVEMDQLISQRENMSIPEIFESRGEEYFRDLETELLIEQQNRKNVVISCGADVPLRERNVAEMKKNGRVALLSASPEVILERVKDSHERPVIEGNKTVEYISSLMEKRREKYMAAADFIVDTDKKSAEEICREIVGKL